jgi:hypothetical protein
MKPRGLVKVYGVFKIIISGKNYSHSMVAGGFDEMS